jgi:hypothetical protein
VKKKKRWCSAALYFCEKDADDCTTGPAEAARPEGAGAGCRCNGALRLQLQGGQPTLGTVIRVLLRSMSDDASGTPPDTKRGTRRLEAGGSGCAVAYALVEHGAAGRPGRGRDWVGRDLICAQIEMASTTITGRHAGRRSLAHGTNQATPPPAGCFGIKGGAALLLREGSIECYFGKLLSVTLMCTPFPTPRRARIISRQVSRCPLCELDTPSHVGHVSDRCKCLGVLDTPPSPSHVGHVSDRCKRIGASPLCARRPPCPLCVLDTPPSPSPRRACMTVR